jgi:hypothetical protein
MDIKQDWQRRYQIARKKQGSELVIFLSGDFGLKNLTASGQREATKRILFQKKYYREELLKEQSPRGYCEAMSLALQNLSRQIIYDIYQTVKAAQTNNIPEG